MARRSSVNYGKNCDRQYFNLIRNRKRYTSKSYADAGRLSARRLNRREYQYCAP